MKNYFFICTLFCVFNFHTSPLNAQLRTQSKHDHILKIKPLQFFLFTLGAEFEKTINKRVSVQIGGSITSHEVELWEGLKGTLSGYSFSPQIKYYLKPAYSFSNYETIAPLGIYTSGWFKFQRDIITLNIGEESAEMLNGEAYSGGLLLGYQFWLKFSRQRIALIDLQLGGGYKLADYAGRFSEKGKVLFFTRNGFVPKLSFSIGLPLGR